MKLPLGVTVAGKHPGRYLDEAKARAAEWGLPLLERPLKGSLAELLETRADALFVLGGDGWVLADAAGSLSFSPGMSLLRIKRLAAGQADDVIVRLCELRPGDSVLDGTLGLAADAQVCAHVVGATGRVVGVEASRALALLAREGLRRAGSPIEVVHGSTLEVLRRQEAGSFDCVILDPMFELPRRASPAFETLRRFAVHEPLDAETLAEARRVARRWVVVKGGRYGKDFKRVGLAPVELTRGSPVMWARVPGGSR
ncbi:MAG: class I SAM-dependent methyltransferase [Myxococcota bacterium]